MEPWQERLLTERAELLDKTDKLDLFLYTDAYAELGSVERMLLGLQLKIMKAFHAVLQARIAIFQPNEEAK